MPLFLYFLLDILTSRQVSTEKEVISAQAHRIEPFRRWPALHCLICEKTEYEQSNMKIQMVYHLNEPHCLICEEADLCLSDMQLGRRTRMSRANLTCDALTCSECF